MESNINFGFGVWDFSFEYEKNDYAESISNNITTWFWQELKKSYWCIRSPNLDYILSEAFSKNIDLIAIFSSGSATTDIDSFINDIITDYMNKDFLVIGHILDRTDKNEYYELHHQCFVINVKKWNELNRPDIGFKKKNKETTFIDPIRSIDNIHDNYTPLWIKPSSNFIKPNKVRLGYNFIHQSLINGIECFNFSSKIRDYKVYSYKEYYDGFNFFITDSESRISRTRNHTFLFNYGDSLIPKKIDIGQIDRLYCTAAGFYANNLLDCYGFKDSTTVIYYDISNTSLLWKRHLNENWNGSNLKKFVDQSIDKFHPFFTEKTFINNGYFTIDNDWNKFLDEFGGEEKWINHWSSFKNLKFKYRIANMLYENSIEPGIKSLNMETQRKNEVFYFSNIFTYYQSWIFRGRELMNQSWDNFCDGINELNPNMYLIGNDTYLQPLNMETLHEYNSRTILQ